MNTARLAMLLRELADEFERGEPREFGSSDSAPTKTRRVKVHPAPIAPPSELDIARARGMLRRRGIAT